jgi:hypothetical protein
MKHNVTYIFTDGGLKIKFNECLTVMTAVKSDNVLTMKGLWLQLYPLIKLNLFIFELFMYLKRLDKKIAKA